MTGITLDFIVKTVYTNIKRDLGEMPAKAK